MPVTAGRLWDSVVWPTIFYRPACQTSSCCPTNLTHDKLKPRNRKYNLKGNGVSVNQDPVPSSAEREGNYTSWNEMWHNKAVVVVSSPCCYAQAPHCQEESEDSHVKDDDSVGSQVAWVQCQQPVQRGICHRCGRCGGRCGGNGYCSSANICQHQPAELSAGHIKKSQNQRRKR